MVEAYSSVPGRRGRAPSGVPSSGTAILASAFRVLEGYRLAHETALAEAGSTLRTMGIEARSRLKTSNTFIEKLKRERTRLSKMRDIAGLRVEAVEDLLEQERIVAQLRRQFEHSEIVDRRVRPNHGYRAVHLIVTLHGFPVEIQVRTTLQHRWVECLEKMADDLYGRDLRYQGPEDSGERSASDSRRSAGSTASELYRDLMKASELIANFEVMNANDQQALSWASRHQAAEPQHQDEIPALVEEAYERLEGLKERLKQLLDGIADRLQAEETRRAAAQPRRTR